MTSRDFCYWLQGYFEIHNVAAEDAYAILTGEQIRCIQKHLALVFKHEIDPSYGDEKHQVELNNIHGQKKSVPRC